MTNTFLICGVSQRIISRPDSLLRRIPFFFLGSSNLAADKSVREEQSTDLANVKLAWHLAPAGYLTSIKFHCEAAL